jgi:hypothetical protein
MILTLEEAKTKAPAIFTNTRSPKVTDRYSFIPTVEILDPFLSEGWQIASAAQRGKDPHGKHFVRLRHDSLPAVGDTIPELIVSNSHDGSTPFNLSTGLHRLVCSNGLTVPTALSHTFKVRHLRFTVQDVKEVTDEFSGRLPIISTKVKEMAARALTFKEQCAYVDQATLVRWENGKTPFLKYEEILAPKRTADSDPTLWNTFNIVQENFVKGGFPFLKDTGKRMHALALKDTVRVNKMNQELWELAEAML